MTNPPYLVGREISALSLSLHIWHPVTAGINLLLIVLPRGSSGDVWNGFQEVAKFAFKSTGKC